MQEFETGHVQANGLRFHYLEMGEGPLALCLHGFPDSPYTYRYLLPELAEAGYRAVSPFNRGFAPTEVPADRHHVHTSTMVADAVALHQHPGGGGRPRQTAAMRTPPLWAPTRYLSTKHSVETATPCSSPTIGER